MRGWPSSSVADCSASWARKVTRCSFRRRSSSVFRTSETSTASPDCSMSRIRCAFELGVRLLRPRVVQLGVDFAHLLVGKRGVVGADEQAGFGAEILDARLVFGDLLAETVDLAGQPLPGGTGLILLGRLLQHEVTFGNRIGDLRRKLGIARLEFDDDHARLVDGVDSQPVVIGVKYALFGRHLERIATDTDHRQQCLQRRNALEHRVKLRSLGKLVLLDDLPREIARQHELELARHGLRIRRRAFFRAVGRRPEEHVLAPLDENPGFGLVARRDDVDGGERQRRGDDGRDQNPGLALDQRLPDRAKVEVAGRSPLFGRNCASLRRPGRRRLTLPERETHVSLHGRNRHFVFPWRLQLIKVAGALIRPPDRGGSGPEVGNHPGRVTSSVIV